MDLPELFRRADLLRERNYKLREAVATSIEQLKAAERERPNYDQIKEEINHFADRRADSCRDAGNDTG